MIISGDEILTRGLLEAADKRNLKNSTYDLTVGRIVPIGTDHAKDSWIFPDGPQSIFLEPRQMVWVLSRESFKLPGTVTGLATLRTTLTKDGILALNVGILDPLFEGPISTTLLNFSDRPREIRVGDKFFRILFFEHQSVKEEYSVPMKIDRKKYLRDLKNWSYSDFPSNFMDMKDHTKEYQAELLGRLIWAYVSEKPLRSIVIAAALVLAAFSGISQIPKIDKIMAIFNEQPEVLEK